MLLNMTVITVCYRSRRTRRKKSSTTSATTRRRQTDKRRYQRCGATTPPSSRLPSVTSLSFRPTKQRRRSAAMQALAWKRHSKRQYTSHAPSIKARKGQTYRDPVYGAAWREKMPSKYTDAAFRSAWRQKMGAKYTDGVYQGAWSHRMRQTMPRRMRVNGANLKFRATERRKLQQSRHLKRVSDPVAAFTQHIQKGSIYSCVSCHCHLYWQTVVKLNLSRCKPESRQLHSAMLAAFNCRKGDQLYICRTCQSYIRRN